MKVLKLVLLAALVLLPLTSFAGSTNVDKVSNLHSYYITKHVYKTDLEKHGVSDFWEAALEGDCEDYALFMYKKAKTVGVESTMWIVRTETNELHMVLVVDDVVVDNRFNTTTLKSDSNYKWIAAVPPKHLEKY